MSSQLVDIDADGYNDILVGSFEGVPYLIRGSEEGFSEPQQIKDATEETVVIADFWNHEEDKWDKTDRAESKGHCTSVEAVDWDDDVLQRNQVLPRRIKLSKQMANRS